MTTSPNLSDLIKRNAALEKENAALQAKLDAIRDKLLANSHTITDSPKKLGITPNDKIKALSGLLHEIFGLVKHQYGHIQIKPIEAPKPFSVHRIDSNGYRPDAVHFGIDAMPSILEVLRHIESKQWWIMRNSDSVMIAQSKD